MIKRPDKTKKSNKRHSREIVSANNESDANHSTMSWPERAK